jgi:predicted branched-subunit amino acid permease
MTFEDIWQGLRELVPSFITALPVAIVIGRVTQTGPPKQLVWMG